MSLLNSFGSSTPLLLVVFVEAVGVCWFYGVTRLVGVCWIYGVTRLVGVCWFYGVTRLVCWFY